MTLVGVKRNNKSLSDKELHITNLIGFQLDFLSRCVVNYSQRCTFS